MMKKWERSYRTLYPKELGGRTWLRIEKWYGKEGLADDSIYPISLTTLSRIISSVSFV